MKKSKKSKKSAKKLKAEWAPPPDYRFTETEYVCRPVDEVHDLWARWHHLYGVPWVEEGRGHMEVIGEIDKRPICVAVWWAIIATKRVAFVEGTSQLVDYKMLEDWCRVVFPNTKAWANKANFHNILGPITEALGVESIMGRDVRAVEDAVAAVPRSANYMRRKT